MASAWIAHVKSVYQKMKKKNASYTYGQAMKDAKKTYKKGASAAAAPEEAAPKKRRGRKKKSRMKEEDESE